MTTTVTTTSIGETTTSIGAGSSLTTTTAGTSVTTSTIVRLVRLRLLAQDSYGPLDDGYCNVLQGFVVEIENDGVTGLTGAAMWRFIGDCQTTVAAVPNAYRLDLFDQAFPLYTNDARAIEDCGPGTIVPIGASRPCMVWRVGHGFSLAPRLRLIGPCGAEIIYDVPCCGGAWTFPIEGDATICL